MNSSEGPYPTIHWRARTTKPLVGEQQESTVVDWHDRVLAMWGISVHVQLENN